MQRLKKGDKVRVISGSQKNKEGTIVKMLPKENKAIVEGINVYKKHQKQNAQNQEGGIVNITVPLDLSKLALVEPKAKSKTTKVKFQYKDNKKTRLNKIRVAKVTGNEISGRK